MHPPPPPPPPLFSFFYWYITDVPSGSWTYNLTLTLLLQEEKVSFKLELTDL